MSFKNIIFWHPFKIKSQKIEHTYYILHHIWIFGVIFHVLSRKCLTIYMYILCHHIILNINMHGSCVRAATVAIYRRQRVCKKHTLNTIYWLNHYVLSCEYNSCDSINVHSVLYVRYISCQIKFLPHFIAFARFLHIFLVALQQCVVCLVLWKRLISSIHRRCTT